MNVPDHAHDFPPIVLRADANSLPERSRGFIPIIARHFFRNNRHGMLVVDVAPGEVAAGEERRAHGLEESGHHELEPAQRKLPGGIRAILREHWIVPIASIHRDSVGQRNCAHPRYAFDFVHQVFLHVDHGQGVLHV